MTSVVTHMQRTALNRERKIRELEAENAKLCGVMLSVEKMLRDGSAYRSDEDMCISGADQLIKAVKAHDEDDSTENV